MTAATASRTPAARELQLPGLLAGLAVTLGRTLETWGRRHAARLNDRERMLRTIDARRTAQAAIDERDALLRSASFQPLR